jgi:hypothetical protein
MADDKPGTSNFRYEDSAIAETFADGVGQWRFDGHTLRIEFLVDRFDEPKPSQPPTGRKVPVCRLVLSANGAIELLNRSRQLTAALEKKGVVKTTPQEKAKEKAKSN